MKRSRDDFEDTVAVARGFLADRASPTYGDKGLVGDFAEALVQIADACVIGLPCEKHGGMVHGQEAEELRAGVEQILKNTADVDDDAAPDVLRSLRKALIFLLDRIDARDSLAFLEAVDGDDQHRLRPRSAASLLLAYHRSCTDRRAFFAALSPGDKISWGIDRSGVIQKIEDDHVTILDDGWPADLPLCDHTSPFVTRLRIDCMLHPKLVEKAVSP